MRYFIDISYIGKNFHGWQIQENAKTIQSNVDVAISKLFKKDIQTVGSGRTDTGVHALSQVAHFDYGKEINNDFIEEVFTDQPAIQENFTSGEEYITPVECNEK